MADMSNLMKQAQAMQGKLQEIQKQIENLNVTGIAGAGSVKIEITGRHKAKKVEIDDSLLTNKPVLEELICAAFDDAVSKINSSKTGLFVRRLSSISTFLAL